MTIPIRIATFVGWPPAIGSGNSGHNVTYNNGVITAYSFIGQGVFVPAQWRTRNWTLYGVPLTPLIVTTLPPTYSPINAGYRTSNYYVVGNDSNSVINWLTVDTSGVPHLGIDISVDRSWVNPTYGVYLSGLFFGRVSGGNPGVGHPGRQVLTSWVPGGFATHNVYVIELNYDPGFLGTGDDGYLYYTIQKASPGHVKLIKLTTGLVAVHEWSEAEVQATELGSIVGQFFVWRNLICFRGPSNDGHTYIKLVKIAPDFSLSDYGTPMLVGPSGGDNETFTAPLGGCYGIEPGGTFSLCDKQPMVWSSP